MSAVAVSEADLALIARDAVAAFAKLDGARVLVTGGTGFVGGWLLRGLLAARRNGVRIEATVLTRDPGAFAAREPGLAALVRCVAGDIRRPLPESGAYDAVVHAAAETNVSGARVVPLDYHDVSLEGTRRVLEAATASGATRLLFVSSGAIYGGGAFASGAAREEDDVHAPSPLDVRAAYGNAKRAAEALVAAYAAEHDLAVTTARLFAFVGPGLPTGAGYAVGNFLADARAGRAVEVSGDGTPVRSYLYAAEMAVHLWTMLAAGAPGRAYNLGSGRAIALGDLARLVAERCGTGVVRIRGRAVPGALRNRYVPDVTRAETELGLRASVTLEEALLRG